MPRVAVTGATGFLGTFLTRALRERGYSVTCVHSRNHDLRHAQSLDSIRESFDIVFHLAAWTQAGDFCLRHPGEQWLFNQCINTNVLNWWYRQHPAPFLVTIGTSCAYDPAIPLVEDNYLRGTPIDGLFTYAMTKRMMYAGQLALTEQYGLKSLCVVPSTLYGPEYHLDGRQMHFVFDLIRKIIRGAHRGEAVELWGDGSQRRELVHVADFVSLMLALADARTTGLVNIATGEDYTIREFAAMICEIVGYDSDRIRYDTTKYVGARSKKLVNERLIELLPAASFTSLSAGLKETVNWFANNGSAFI